MRARSVTARLVLPITGWAQRRAARPGVTVVAVASAFGPGVIAGRDIGRGSVAGGGAVGGGTVSL